MNPAQRFKSAVGKMSLHKVRDALPATIRCIPFCDSQLGRGRLIHSVSPAQKARAICAQSLRRFDDYGVAL